MKEDQLLRGLRRHDTRALEAAIERYTPLVSAIVYNIIGHDMDQMDVEDVVSESFYVLWDHADRIAPGKLSAYLGSIARSRAKNKLRTYRPALSVEDAYLEFPDGVIEDGLTAEEQAQAVRQAVLALGEPDREIFLRHYYHYQTTGTIAAEMGLNCSTVQTKLKRGREKLKECLLQGGYFDEI